MLLVEKSVYLTKKVFEITREKKVNLHMKYHSDTSSDDMAALLLKISL